MRTTFQVVRLEVMTIKRTGLMTIECQKARWLEGEEREQSSKSSGSPVDTVLVRVFKSGWLRLQVAGLQIEDTSSVGYTPGALVDQVVFRGSVFE